MDDDFRCDNVYNVAKFWLAQQLQPRKCRHFTHFDHKQRDDTGVVLYDQIISRTIDNNTVKRMFDQIRKEMHLM